jgi:hypothetical protein
MPGLLEGGLDTECSLRPARLPVADPLQLAQPSNKRLSSHYQPWGIRIRNNYTHPDPDQTFLKKKQVKFRKLS